jgi:membrane protein implicated in regulation of membrane protease activity
MALTVAIVIALLFLAWPWNLLVILGGLAIEAGELTWGLRLARKWRPATGAEAMIGEEAEVATACRPEGQVRINGELWRARCEAGADVGDTVRVERLDGLTLVVSPSQRGASA